MLAVAVLVVAPVPVPNPTSASVSADRAALFNCISKFGICVVVATVMVVAAVTASVVAVAATPAAAAADEEDIVSPARLMLLITFAQSVGWLLSTNSRCARARPASRPWQMFEMSNQIR